MFGEHESQQNFMRAGVQFCFYFSAGKTYPQTGQTVVVHYTGMQNSVYKYTTKHFPFELTWNIKKKVEQQKQLHI